MAAAIVPTPTPRIAPKCIKEIARLIATSDDALTGGKNFFSGVPVIIAEGMYDGAKDAVKPLPKQGIRCYPAQQVHRKIYAVAEGEQCYKLAQQLTPVNLPQQDGLSDDKKQI